MKKTILLLCFALFAASTLRAQVTLSESFDYPAGDSIGAHGWTWYSGTSNTLLVATPGLDFVGYQSPGIGNSCKVNTTGNDNYKDFSTQLSGGSVYAFFLVRIDAAQTTGDYFTALLPTVNPSSSLFARVYAKASATPTKFAFGIAKSSGTGAVIGYSADNYTYGLTYLLVAKYTFVAGTLNDVATLTIFSPGDVVPNSEPAPTLTAGPSTVADAVDLSRFDIRQGTAASAPTLLEDEIWVGTDWPGTLPVELSSFTSTIINRDVTLNWSTSIELNNSGFDIERSSSDNSWTKIANMAGKGTSATQTNYTFTDRGLTSGNYSYRLKQIDFNGNFEYFNLNNEVVIGLPVQYQLSQNYPNPFNPSTVINYQLPSAGNVNIVLYDINGREINTLVNENKEAGFYSVTFNGNSLSSGIYFYTLRANGFTNTKSMLLVK